MRVDTDMEQEVNNCSDTRYGSLRNRQVNENCAEAHGKKKRGFHFLFDCQENQQAADNPHNDLTELQVCEILKNCGKIHQKFAHLKISTYTLY